MVALISQPFPALISVGQVLTTKQFVIPQGDTGFQLHQVCRLTLHEPVFVCGYQVKESKWFELKSETRTYSLNMYSIWI